MEETDGTYVEVEVFNHRVHDELSCSESSIGVFLTQVDFDLARSRINLRDLHKSLWERNDKIEWK